MPGFESKTLNRKFDRIWFGKLGGAALVVGKMFYNQKPELLEYVLTKDVNRVNYSDLKPPKDRFDEMMTLGVEMPPGAEKPTARPMM